MSDLGREWFLWAFDYAMDAAVRQHGDAARLAAYDGRKAFDEILPRGVVGVVRDSDAGFAGDRNGLHPEGAAARAEGIARPPFPSEQP